MRFTTSSALFFLSSVAGVANAHFELLYPTPRGVYAFDKEPEFCGGYPNAVSNRSVFPLSGGFFVIDTGHEGFTAGVQISTAQNPDDWEDFVNEPVRAFARSELSGEVCIPLNLNATGIEGVQDGANVTIQIVLAGDDGKLYQCSDLTLSSTYTIPSSQTCQNASSSGHGHESHSESASASSSAPAPTSSGAGNGATAVSANVAFVAAIAGAVIFSL